NVGLRSFLAQTFDDLGAGNTEEADRHEHTTDCVLSITELDSLEVQDGEGVGANQTVEGKNLVHLNGGNESAPALADDVGNGNDVSELRSERSSDRCITKLKSGWFVITY